MFKFILSLTLAAIFFTQSVYAKEEFATSYDVVYDIDNSGITTVMEKINLKNLTAEYYADEFKLTIGATDVFDINASDGGGIMEVASEKKENITEIKVKFNQQIVGINKVLSWTLQFKSKDFAQKSGKVWEVRIPKIAPSASLQNYNLTLVTPSVFGEPTIISPTPKSQTFSSAKMFLTFEKENLQSAGVLASFGTSQLFDFDLTYHLENKNLVPVLTNIAIPPDTGYQDVIYQRIEPKPQNVTIDDDGNYLAWFKLKRGEELNVNVVGSAKLYTANKIKNPVLSGTLRKKYTQKDIYWEKDHPQILNKLAEILGENTNLSNIEKAGLIHKFVVNFLRYDPLRLSLLNEEPSERLGAVTVLNNPDSAVSMEFTDLFIALARSANIPARELDGYALSNNSSLRPLSLGKDILHAWVEYWDDTKGWVMIDPTWQNTTGGVDYFNKLDLNHFVFTIKGSSSQKPITAGAYKYSSQDTNYVKVTLSDNDFLGKAQLDVKIEHLDPVLAGFPGKIKVKVRNIGNSVYNAHSFLLSAHRLIILDGKRQLGPIPPFGEAVFEFNIRTKSLFERFDDLIIVYLGDQKFEEKITVMPFLLFQTYPLVAVFIVFLLGLIYFLILGHKIYKFKILPKIEKPKKIKHKRKK